MARNLPPPPSQGKNGIPEIWANWLLQLRDFVTQATGTISWSTVDKTGSSIADLTTKTHTLLGSVQGGNATEQYHLTATQHTDLTDTGDTTLHYHASDRARANHTGTQTLSTISDAGTAAAKNTGTSGNTVPLLDGNNTWSGTQQFTYLGINAAPISGRLVQASGTIPGTDTTKYGITFQPAFSSSTTSVGYCFLSAPSTQAASFTLSQLNHYVANGVTLGTSSGISFQYGFHVTSNNTQATNNYGFYGNIASATGRWNFYANGTAANHFTGATTFGTSLGYGTTSGVGGAVTQATSKSTGVTLNKICGQITMNNAALAAATGVSFTVTNSTVAATDTIIIHRSSGGTAGAYQVDIDSVAAGSFVVTLRNTTAGSLSEAPVLNFSVIKATNA